MNLRKNILTALLLAIGFILRQLTPGALGGMKFDLFLSFIFICLLLNPTFKNAILTGLLGGILNALTTTFPGGQLPNVIDKLITCVILFIIIKVMIHVKDNQIFVGFIAFLGTLISGTVFLTSALFISGLPAPFTLLFMTIVLPTSLANIVMTLVVYQVVQSTLKMTGVKFA
ncbi:putative tryptophan transport protein [Alkaliphilus metalliredigens QYMF]|uniref:Putative tryptophan transport protein n=1 Tax=Alkaliphilus metalliredigens (strain QYMF) TaxID=293826 RepID=A6TWR4_ALKMQ|nr:tryptophan transporter [Alkaliphilus metalliredigens]ABR50632.1 putative tryptophan transport protein [Alkaliphilus metalliredigens QYMF]